MHNTYVHAYTKTFFSLIDKNIYFHINDSKEAFYKHYEGSKTLIAITFCALIVFNLYPRYTPDVLACNIKQ